MTSMTTKSLDLTLFRWIESQTSQRDRLALLSIQEALCDSLGAYRYLEVGSHLGGSLQPHIVNRRCLRIFSIDPRPMEQPDERWTQSYKYEGNSTQRMLNLLSKIPDAEMSKVHTFETSADQLSSSSISDKIDFAFVDGEHTNRAVLRDFHSVKRFLSECSVLAFHDAFAVASAILQIRRLLAHGKLRYRFVHFPHSSVIAIVFAQQSLETRLIEFGWQPRLPFTRWHVAKYSLAKSITQLHSALRRLRTANIYILPEK